MAKRVTGFEAFGIYGDFDGYADPTEDVVLVETQELADEMVGVLHKRLILDLDVGLERTDMLTFLTRQVVEEDESRICSSVEQALEMMFG